MCLYSASLYVLLYLIIYFFVSGRVWFTRRAWRERCQGIVSLLNLFFPHLHLNIFVIQSWSNVFKSDILNWPVRNNITIPIKIFIFSSLFLLSLKALSLYHSHFSSSPMSGPSRSSRTTRRPWGKRRAWEIGVTSEQLPLFYIYLDNLWSNALLKHFQSELWSKITQNSQYRLIMNVHVFQGPEGHKGDKGEPVCASIGKHKNNFILYPFFKTNSIFHWPVMLCACITESQFFLSCWGSQMIN